MYSQSAAFHSSSLPLSTNMNLTFISKAPQTLKGSIPGLLWFERIHTKLKKITALQLYGFHLWLPKTPSCDHFTAYMVLNISSIRLSYLVYTSYLNFFRTLADPHPLI